MKRKEYESTEIELKSYYRDLNQLDWLHKKVELYQNQCNQILEDMKDFNVSFDSDISGVSYDNPVVQTSGTHGLEKLIDTAYEKMQKELDSINQKIADTKKEMRAVEEKTAKLGYFIKLLSRDAQLFLELYYHKKRKSYVAIGLELNVSHSTVGRFKREVLQQIDLLLNYS